MEVLRWSFVGFRCSWRSAGVDEGVTVIIDEVGPCKSKPFEIRVEHAWFQLLRPQHDELVARFAFNLNMWRYNEVATSILYVLPEVAALVVFSQLVSLSNSYRAQIRALRHGDHPFNRHERSNELPSAASEWVGYQLILSGFTFFSILFILTVIAAAITYPVVYCIINWGRIAEIKSWVWNVFISWVLGLAGGVFRTSTRPDIKHPPPPPRGCMIIHPQG